MYVPNVSAIQAPLRQHYQSSPQDAYVTDRAVTAGTAPNEPFHSSVAPMPEIGVAVPFSVHQAVGGPHDAPTPGDLLCAALAACQESSIRMVANILGVELETLQVEVRAEVDVRGTLAIAKEVPVGFQAIDCQVKLQAKAGTDPQLIERLQHSAEQCCVVLQTLRSPPPVKVKFSSG